jgi:hypothetical protein
MTRTLLKDLAALSLLAVATAPACAYWSSQVGTWTHTATVGDHRVKVTLDVTANTIHCTLRTEEGAAAVTITVEADYVMSRDGIVAGILAPGKAPPKGSATKDEKGGVEERAFTCRVNVEEKALVLSDLGGGGSDKDQIKKVFEGRYRRVEAKATTKPSKSKEAGGDAHDSRTPVPPLGSTFKALNVFEDTDSAAKASFGLPDPTQVAELHARTSIRFAGPKGLKVAWQIENDGKKAWGDEVLEAPAKHDFAQAAVYRLKLSDIPDNPGLSLYPTLEVVPGNSGTRSFLSEHSVPVGFTADDFRAVKAGNYVAKVIYLTGPSQDFFSGEVGEVTSEQVERGVDPITEATRRGSILAVVRLGNIDMGKRALPAINYPPPGDVRSPRWTSPVSR